MKTEQFDKKFDSGEDISKYLEFSKATRPGREEERKVWIAERLDAKTHA